MVSFWYTKHIDLVALRGYVTSMQEVFHVMDTSYYYVVGALSGAVALQYAACGGSSSPFNFTRIAQECY
jgi:hypothetical protein